MDRRDEFLVVMYGKMWDNINRHLTVVWESAAILAGAVAVFALAEEDTLRFDLACTLLVLVSVWTIMHAFDANSWYNRNLAIIANIERAFLDIKDAEEIHPYFLTHRSHELVEHLRIHGFLGVGFSALTLAYHFFIRVRPGLRSPLNYFEPQRSLPYVVAIVGAIAIGVLRHHYKRQHAKFEKQAPGIQFVES